MMRPIVAAIHGIMTRQTVASWVDRFDAWCYVRNVPAHVVKKEYRAAPFPFANVYVKNWFLKWGLAADIETLVRATERNGGKQPRIHFVSHSNGTDIALKTIRTLAKRGIKTEAAIFVGSVLRSDIRRNGVARLIGEGSLRRAYAYCSRRDGALAIPRLLPICAYGHLGITGWTYGDTWMPEQVHLQSNPGDGPDLVTRRYDRYGHGDYFASGNIDETFAQFRKDLAI